MTHLTTFLSERMLQSPVAYLRSRACWVIEYVSEMSFSNPTTLQAILKVRIEIAYKKSEMIFENRIAIFLSLFYWFFIVGIYWFFVSFACMY